MFSTIPITVFIRKWRDAIANSAAISAFCIEKYNKPLSLYVGIDGKKPPTDKNCPLVIVFPGGKVEGGGEAECRYTGSIGWSIIQPGVANQDGITENIGLYEADELGQLILTAIAEINPSYPVTRVEYSFESNEFFPQFPGRMDITIQVPVVMGMQITY